MAEGLGGTRISEPSERDHGGAPHVLVVAPQLLDQSIDHRGTVTHQGFDDIGANLGAAEQLGQRDRHGWRLHPSEQDDDRAQLVLRRVAKRIEQSLHAGGGQCLLELGNDVRASAVAAFISGVQRDDGGGNGDDRGSRTIEHGDQLPSHIAIAEPAERLGGGLAERFIIE
jgi:hypothetical protein